MDLCPQGPLTPYFYDLVLEFILYVAVPCCLSVVKYVVDSYIVCMHDVMMLVCAAKNFIT